MVDKAVSPDLFQADIDAFFAQLDVTTGLKRERNVQLRKKAGLGSIKARWMERTRVEEVQRRTKDNTTAVA
jgi:hypothetical protein